MNDTYKKIVVEAYPSIKDNPILIQHLINCIKEQIKGNQMSFKKFISKFDDYNLILKGNEHKYNRAVLSCANCIQTQNGKKLKIKDRYMVNTGVNFATRIKTKKGNGYLKYSLPLYLNNLELIMTKFSSFLGINVPEVELVKTMYNNKYIYGILSHSIKNYVSFKDLYSILEENDKLNKLNTTQKKYYKRLKEISFGKTQHLNDNNTNKIFLVLAYFSGALALKLPELNQLIKDFYITIFVNCLINNLDMNTSNIGIEEKTKKLAIIDNNFGYYDSNTTIDKQTGKNATITILNYKINKHTLLNYFFNNKMAYNYIKEIANYIVENEDILKNKIQELISSYGDNLHQVTTYHKIFKSNLEEIKILYKIKNNYVIKA